MGDALAPRGTTVPREKTEKTENQKEVTHDSSEITVELFDDCGETPRSHVEELPTPPHRPSVPSRRGVFVDGGQVTLRCVEELELKEGLEVARAGEQELEQTFRGAHLFLFSGGRMVIIREETLLVRLPSVDVSALLMSITPFLNRLKRGKKNVGRPAQSTSTNPTNGCEKNSSKVCPSSCFPVPGRLSGETRLGQDAGGQHDHRSTPEAFQRSGAGTGDEKIKMRYDTQLFSYFTVCSFDPGTLGITYAFEISRRARWILRFHTGVSQIRRLGMDP